MSESCNEWWKSRVAKSWEAIGLGERGLNPKPPPQVTDAWEQSRVALFDQLCEEMQMSLNACMDMSKEEEIIKMFDVYTTGVLYSIAHRVGLKRLDDKCTSLKEFADELMDIISPPMVMREQLVNPENHEQCWWYDWEDGPNMPPVKYLSDIACDECANE